MGFKRFADRLREFPGAITREKNSFHNAHHGVFKVSGEWVDIHLVLQQPYLLDVGAEEVAGVYAGTKPAIQAVVGWGVEGAKLAYAVACHMPSVSRGVKPLALAAQQDLRQENKTMTFSLTGTRCLVVVPFLTHGDKAAKVITAVSARHGEIVGVAALCRRLVSEQGLNSEVKRFPVTSFCELPQAARYRRAPKIQKAIASA